MKTNEPFTEEQLITIKKFVDEFDTITFLESLDKAVKNSSFDFYPKAGLSRCILVKFITQYLIYEAQHWNEATPWEVIEDELIHDLISSIEHFVEDTPKIIEKRKKKEEDSSC